MSREAVSPDPVNQGAKSLCIIPARGGSKRIPRKNIRPFRGRPMLAWPVQAALKSGVFDTVMVSTDDDEIAAIARDLGAEIPFMRSAQASSDHATTADVLREVIDRYAQDGRTFELACNLYPTAPLATPEDLRTGLSVLQTGGFDAVLPVAAFSYPILRSLARGQDGRVRLNFPEHRDTRSQDLAPAYHDAGQWCWFRVDAFSASGVLLGDNTGSVVLAPDRVQDIDTEDDWAMAVLKHERLTP